MERKPDDQAKFWERYQRFSEKHYSPYAGRWFGLKTNLIVAVIAVTVLGLFVFTSNR